MQELFAEMREEVNKQFRETIGIDLQSRAKIYQKPYPAYFDSVGYPTGWRLPEFMKFNGDDNRTTWEHISQYLAQLGEAGSVDALKVRLFSIIAR